MNPTRRLEIVFYVACGRCCGSGRSALAIADAVVCRECKGSGVLPAEKLPERLKIVIREAGRGGRR